MNENQIYLEIVTAAMSEHPHLDAVERGSGAYTDAADDLADSLYRLCVEFGVDFNAFKRAVLAEVPQRDTGAEDSEAPLLAGAGRHSALVVLALELMRDDSDL